MNYEDYRNLIVATIATFSGVADEAVILDDSWLKEQHQGLLEGKHRKNESDVANEWIEEAKKRQTTAPPKPATPNKP